VCVDICPAKSLYQKPEYRKPTAERVTVSQQGQPRKKKEKPAKAPEAAAAAAEPPVEVPPPATDPA
jgi:formate hydrogenlyase subunit 6/NADH:ubiquinone oxidoreductase subunit I